MDVPSDQELLQHIEAFLARTGIGHSKFGLRATGEGGLVASLRKGRSLSIRHAKRVLAFIAAYDAPPPPSGGNLAQFSAPAKGCDA